jgi:hypothetical protein
MTTLSSDASRAIEAFQGYIAQQHRTRARTWTHAHQLIQAVGSTLVTAQLEPPTDLTAVAESLGVAIELRPSSTKQLGKLEPIIGGFKALVYGQVRRRVTQPELSGTSETAVPTIQLSKAGRFTVAHELGHVLFYSVCAERSPSRVIPAMRLRPEDYWREEGLCDGFARALLLPDKWKLAVGSSAKFANLLEASAYFQVRGEPLLRRILHDWKLWNDALFVRIVVGSTGLNYRVFRGTARRTDVMLRRDRLLATLGDADSSTLVAGRLVRALGISSRQIMVHGNTVWASL